MSTDPLESILEFIKLNPGCKPSDIRENVPGFREYSGDVINALNVLKLRGVIENRGPREPGKGPGQWHAVEEPKGSLRSQRLAKERFEERLKIESEMRGKIFDILDSYPNLIEREKLRDYLEFFFNPGEVLYQEVVVLPDETDVEEGWEDTSTAVLCAEGKPEVVIVENGFLMHVKIPEQENGGMWVEIQSVNGSGPALDNHDKFKRMLGRPIRVTVELLDKES